MAKGTAKVAPAQSDFSGAAPKSLGVDTSMKLDPSLAAKSASLPDLDKEKLGMRKEALTKAGIGAGAGLLQGIAAALLTPDQQEDRGRSAMPSASVGSVSTSKPGGISYGRQDLPYDRQSLAMELLRGGGYK